MTVIKLQDDNEIYRYRNMLFRLYHAFSDYRDMILRMVVAILKDGRWIKILKRSSDWRTDL